MTAKVEAEGEYEAPGEERVEEDEEIEGSGRGWEWEPVGVKDGGREVIFEGACGEGSEGAAYSGEAPMDGHGDGASVALWQAGLAEAELAEEGAHGESALEESGEAHPEDGRGAGPGTDRKVSWDGKPPGRHGKRAESGEAQEHLVRAGAIHPGA